MNHSIGFVAARRWLVLELLALVRVTHSRQQAAHAAASDARFVGCRWYATPLMLHIATLAYVGRGGEGITSGMTVEEQRDWLLAEYVERMVTRKGGHAHSHRSKRYSG